MDKKVIKIAHSPDADDHFMFWALATGRISSPLFQFEIGQADTQTLNQLSETLDFDIIAVSAAHFPKIEDFYQPLRMGTSVGSGYGPVLVTPADLASELLGEKPISILKAQLRSSHLLTPGRHTTAHNALKALGFDFATDEQVSISPMHLIFRKLEELAHHARSGQAPIPVALLIHEGRLLYEKFGTHLLLDLGLAWNTEFGCDLPLGINVIKRSLSSEEKAHLSEILRESMSYAINNRKEFEDMYLEQGCPLSPHDLTKYLDMYANDTTLDITEAHKIAFETLLSSIPGSTEMPKRKSRIDWI